MARNKTQPTGVAVQSFVDRLASDHQRADSATLIAMMREATGSDPVMWGPSIVGFGQYRYRYASGRTGDWFAVGFSPRKTAISVYLTGGLDRHTEQLALLGPYKRGKGCLYLKRLSDVDLGVLRAIIDASVSVASELDGAGPC